VADIGRAIAELKGRGVRFADYDYPGLKTVEHVCVLGSEKAAWFEDPRATSCVCTRTSADLSVD
jgi:hypothetical protein